MYIGPLFRSLPKRFSLGSRCAYLTVLTIWTTVISVPWWPCQVWEEIDFHHTCSWERLQALVRKAQALREEARELAGHGIFVSSGDFGERLSHPYTSRIWRMCLIDFRAIARDYLKNFSKPLRYVLSYMFGSSSWNAKSCEGSQCGTHPFLDSLQGKGCWKG